MPSEFWKILSLVIYEFDWNYFLLNGAELYFFEIQFFGLPFSQSKKIYNSFKLKGAKVGWVLLQNIAL